MYPEMIKKTIRAARGIFRALNYLLVLLVFLSATLVVICYSTGYKIDIKNKNFKQTGIIDVTSDTQFASIYVNDRFIGNDSISLKNLEPKNYNIKVTKEGYHDWTKAVTLEPGSALLLNDIILFRINPNFEPYESGITTQTIDNLSDTNGLSSSGGEIYSGEIMVTRMLKDVSGVCWYPNHKYIAYTSDGKLKIIQNDGTNSIDLFNKTSSSPVIFTNSGKVVLFEEGGKIFRSEIR